MTVFVVAANTTEYRLVVSDVPPAPVTSCRL